MRRLTLAALASFLVPLAQAQLTVPVPHPTIQSAIAAAPTGGSIVVGPGVYFETIDFGSKILTLTSSAGAAATIIDAQSAGRVVRMTYGSSIEGFTIRNGQAPHGLGPGQNGQHGGGILISAVLCFGCGPGPTSAAIRRCVVEDNRAGNGGPVTASGLLAGSGGSGGGIAIASTLGGEVLIEGCVVSGNRAGTRGGCCSVDGHGGGIAFGPPSSILAAVGTLRIVNSLVSDNETELTSTFPPVQGQGGGIWLSASSTAPANLVVESSTITDNRAPSTSGIVVSPAAGATILRNTIVAGNTMPQLGIPSGVVSHCLVFPESVAGVGNLNVDPRFRDAANGDFRLAPGSPCIDAGLVVPGLPATDVGGDPRIRGATLDIGADEFCGLGSGDDFALLTQINGEGGTACVKSAQVGDALTMTYGSPTGSLDFAPAFLAIQVFSTALPPVSLLDFPFVHLVPTQALVIDGPIFLPPGGFSQSAVIPPGLSTFTLRIQAFVVSPSTLNHIFGASDGHDLES